MSKRRQSPGVLPPAKRLCLTGTSNLPRASHLSFDNLLYDELLLDIFSYLPWANLCLTQSVSRNWARLAGDNELWRKLYIQEYGRSRLRGSRGFISRRDGREVRRLPERALNDQCKVWKWMFRISTNWRRGLSSYPQQQTEEYFYCCMFRTLSCGGYWPIYPESGIGSAPTLLHGKPSQWERQGAYSFGWPANYYCIFRFIWAPNNLNFWPAL